MSVCQFLVSTEARLVGKALEASRILTNPWAVCRSLCWCCPHNLHITFHHHSAEHPPLQHKRGWTVSGSQWNSQGQHGERRHSQPPHQHQHISLITTITVNPSLMTTLSPTLWLGYCRSLLISKWKPLPRALCLLIWRQEEHRRSELGFLIWGYQSSTFYS